jgi:hypothetical protein
MTLITDLNQLEQEAVLDQPATKREVSQVLAAVVSQTNSTAVYANTLAEYLAVKGLRLCQDGRARIDTKEWSEYLINTVNTIQTNAKAQ